MELVRSEIRQHVEAVRSAAGRAVGGMLDTGRELVALKAACIHGEWTEALKASGVPERTAQRLMRAWHQYEASGALGKPPTVTALLEAARQSIPDTLSDLPLDSDDVRMLDPQPILDAVAVLDSLGTDLSGASMRFLAWLCVGDGVNCWIEAQYGVKSYGGAITDALNSVGQANHRDLCRDADTLHASTVLLLQRFLKKAIDHQADRLAH